MLFRSSFLLFSAFQAVVGVPVGSNCCGSKTVGGIAYTLVETKVTIPDECLNSCAYMRDDQPGSLFCFSKGELPVQCTSENPVPMCYQGCGPDFNTKIVDSTPHDISTRPTFIDCWDYCRSLCTDWWCSCHAWSYHELSEKCYTYPGPFQCHQTANGTGWVSGGLCFEDNTRPILEYEAIPGGDVTKSSKLTIGNLLGATAPFDDGLTAAGGEITKVTMYTDKYFTHPNVIVGIQITYGGSEAILHGKQTENKTECKFDPGSGEAITQIFGTAIDSPSSSAALIYSLGFSTDVVSACVAGNQDGGYTFRQDTTGQTKIYATGLLTPRNPNILGQLTFIIGGGKTCDPCSDCDGDQSKCEATSTCSYDDNVCKDSPSPVDGEWGNWGAWGDCQQTGYQERYRECNNPPPSDGGADCPGESTDRQSCPVNPGECNASYKAFHGCEVDENKCNSAAGYGTVDGYNAGKAKCCCKCCNAGLCGREKC